ncbi:MAG: glycosyltransferase family 4 protein [Bythopirellula sp.]|nr:glycosyltransferase family 4 protein [Bythopirellula sp.]
MEPSASENGVDLRVVMLPWTDGNPYQTLLKRAIEAAGARVTPATLVDDWLARLEQVQADILHLHWLHGLTVGRSIPRTLIKSGVFLRKLSLARRRVKGIVWTCHNLGNHHGWCLGLERTIVRQACHSFDRIIVHHEAAIDDVVAYFKIPNLRDRFDVIPHGHYLDWYQGSLTKIEARRKLGIPDDEVVFLLFGQLRANKGIDVLLAAFKAACQVTDAPIRLLLAGTADAEVTNLIKQAMAQEPRIDFREGFVADEMVQPLHAAADVAVLPFSSGLTSGSLILAMGFGLPVIAAKFGEAGQMADKLGGILIQSDSVLELKNAFQEMISARPDWAEMSQRNHQLNSQRDWTNIGQQTMECYRRASKQRQES